MVASVPNMIPLISILVGLIFLAIFSLLLWVMLARPKQWASLTQKEHDFWVRRGMPVQWAGAIRDSDRGWVAKVLVAFTVIVAVVLIASAIIFHHHG